MLPVLKSERLLLSFSALRVYWDTKPSFTPFTPFTTLILLKRNASLLTHGNSNFSLLNFAHSESTECKSSEQAVCPWSELERHLVKHFKLFPVTPSHLNPPQQRAVNAVVATSSYFYHQFNCCLRCSTQALNIQTLFGETRPEILRRIVSDWLENDCPAQDVSSLTGFKRMPTVWTMWELSKHNPIGWDWASCPIWFTSPLLSVHRRRSGWRW